MGNHLKTITAAISLFIIGTIPILFAAVEPWVWSVYSMLMIVVFLLHLWFPSVPNSFHAPRSAMSLIVLFFIWTFIHGLPLPYSVFSHLSPARADILSRAATLINTEHSWEALSYLPAVSLNWWVFLLSLGLFYFVVTDQCVQPEMGKRIVFVMIAIGLIEALYGLFQALSPSMGVLWVDYIASYMGRARGTFINRNNFAGFMEMIWPLALGATLAMAGRFTSFREALHSDKLNRQALMALGIIVLLLALVFTRSRGGIISGLAGFASFLILGRPGMKELAKQTRILMGGVFLLLGIYTVSIGIGPIIQRFLSIRGDGSSRLDIWHDSLPILRDYPLGIGLGNYETVFAVYNRSLTSDKVVNYAHNDYLQLLIETGWIGFALLMGALFIFLYSSARKIRKIDYKRNPLQFYLSVGAFSGMVSMLVHGLFDFNFQIPANCLYFTVLMAIIAGCVQKKSPPSEKHTHMTRSENVDARLQ